MSTGTLEIRHATRDDVSAIAAIHWDAWQWTYADTLLHHHLDGHSPEQREAIWVDTLHRYDDGVRLWVAVRDGAVVGFSTTGPLRATPQRLGDVAEMYALYQRPAAAGSGMASRLVANAVEDLRRRGVKELRLSVLEGNERARAFYERQGWSPTRRETYDYDGGKLTQICYRRAL